MSGLPPYFLKVRGDRGEPRWRVEWRHTGPDGEQRKFNRVVGLAWMDPDGDGGWRKRRGRTPETHLDPRTVHAAAEALVRRVEREADAEDTAEPAPPITFRDVARDWLSWLERVKGAKPSTLQDHGYLLAEPGTPHRRGGGTFDGRIMATLGDKPAADVTTRDVEKLLEAIARSGVSPRTVNKHRNLLGAIYTYACRPSTFALTVNPVRDADRRAEPSANPREYYSVEQVEAVARALAAGRHRDARDADVGEEELAAMAAEDQQTAEAMRVAAYTGIRMGELRGLRWRDVDFAGAKLIIRRSVSAGTLVESTKSRKVREVPLADVAMAALDRLSRREDFVGPDDYVVCSRAGARVDDSAMRRRFKAAQREAGVPALTWHGLRHTFGSLCAADPNMDFVTLKAAMGHARITTTERYLHARPASQAAARFSAVFGRHDHATDERKRVA